jgi:hypothetical protein
LNKTRKPFLASQRQHGAPVVLLPQDLAILQESNQKQPNGTEISFSAPAITACNGFPKPSAEGFGKDFLRCLVDFNAAENLVKRFDVDHVRPSLRR